MKKNLLILLAGMITASPSCTKLGKIDGIIHTSGKMCPILATASLDSIGPGVPLTSLLFFYDSAGHPIMIHNSTLFRIDPYRTEYHFRYDRFNRLSDFIRTERGSIIFNQALSWHRYSYQSRNIVVDSVYGVGAALITDPNPSPESFEGVNVHYLDKDGRIVKDEKTFNGALTITYFKYDLRGNLTRDGVQYDNKLNPYLTNEVWRFIYEDYSLNNPLIELNSLPPVTIRQYNALGFPQIIHNDNAAYLFNYGFEGGVHIFYGCDATQGAPAKEAY